MELAKKFEEATSCQSVNIRSLEIDKNTQLSVLNESPVNSDQQFH